MDFKNYFSHVIIDEAGQSIESQTLIPLSMISSASTDVVGQIVLAGDPKQLGAMSVSKVFKSLSLDVSMLERLLTNDSCYSQTFGPDKNEFNNFYVTQLKINYRSHPSILQVFNQEFYENTLEAGVHEKTSAEAQFLEPYDFNYNLKEKVGIYFYNVYGTDTRNKETKSWNNNNEAFHVNKFLTKCIEAKIPLKNVGVVRISYFIYSY